MAFKSQLPNFAGFMLQNAKNWTLPPQSQMNFVF